MYIHNDLQVQFKDNMISSYYGNCLHDSIAFICCWISERTCFGWIPWLGLIDLIFLGILFYFQHFGIHTKFNIIFEMTNISWKLKKSIQCRFLECKKTLFSKHSQAKCFTKCGSVMVSDMECEPGNLNLIPSLNQMLLMASL